MTGGVGPRRSSRLSSEHANQTSDAIKPAKGRTPVATAKRKSSDKKVSQVSKNAKSSSSTSSSRSRAVRKSLPTKIPETTEASKARRVGDAIIGDVATVADEGRSLREIAGNVGSFAWDTICSVGVNSSPKVVAVSVAIPGFIAGFSLLSSHPITAVGTVAATALLANHASQRVLAQTTPAVTSDKGSEPQGKKRNFNEIDR